MDSYISELNSEYITPPAPEGDLSSFADTSFFDFDLPELKLDLSYLDKIVEGTEIQQPSPVQQTEVVQQEIKQESQADKKKRNTAASARFRVKKKLREQEMERTLRELTEKVQGYNQRIQQLEMENACLKDLIVQKNERRSEELVRSIREKSLE